MEYSTSAAAVTGWLLTYLIHSTILILSVWLVCRAFPTLSNGMRNLLWKFALIGGVATAAFQCTTDYRPALGTVEVPVAQLATQAAPAALPATGAAVTPAAPAAAPIVERHEIVQDGQVVIVD
ncbi:MAG: hypothetical protein KC468_17810, partial [Myxococcales bacterium]|nr:hypothetical protein [Myxococcales bacterium]